MDRTHTLICLRIVTLKRLSFGTLQGVENTDVRQLWMPWQSSFPYLLNRRQGVFRMGTTFSTISAMPRVDLL